MIKREGQSRENQAVRQPVVLVVDDEILVRSAIADYLRMAGYTVLEAASADEAIAVLTSREPVNLVFTDIEMPGTIDGLELARVVHRQYPGVKMMLTSGRRSGTEAAELVGGGFFLKKPYRLAEVANRIRFWLEQAKN